MQLSASSTSAVVTGSDRDVVGEGAAGFRMLRLGFLRVGRFARGGRPGPDIDEPRPSPNKLGGGSSIEIGIGCVCDISEEVDGNVDVADMDEEDTEDEEYDCGSVNSFVRSLSFSVEEAPS